MKAIDMKPSENFSLRAAAIIRRDNHFLLCKSDRHDCYYFVGGGIEPNESSIDAIRRECFEETGCRFEIDRLVYVQERFYTIESIPHHEITFFYAMKDVVFPIPENMNTDQSDEHLHWIPLENLCSVNIVPSFMKASLACLPAQLTHIISRE